MQYDHYDWKYGLPAKAVMDSTVQRVLHPWCRRILQFDERQVRAELKSRWRKVPGWLRPLRDRILLASAPFVIGWKTESFLGLTLGAEGPAGDHPWIPRPWRTPTRFLAGPARRFLRADPDYQPGGRPLESAAHSAWTSRLDDLTNRWRLAPTPEGQESWEWSIFVSPSGNRGLIVRALRQLNLTDSDDLLEFLVHFDNLRESEPRLSGGFVPAKHWVRVEDDRHSFYDFMPEDIQRAWRGSVTIFHARNGDAFVLAPEGHVGAMLHEEGRIERRWSSFREFVVHYADYLENRRPFDGYGPSNQAIVARRRRERELKGRRRD